MTQENNSELTELIDAAVAAASEGDQTAQEWIDSLDEETWQQWLEEELD